MGITEMISDLIGAGNEEQTVVCPNCSQLADFSEIVEKKGTICCRSCLYKRTKDPKSATMWPRAGVSTFVTSSAATDEMILGISALPHGTAA